MQYRLITFLKIAATLFFLHSLPVYVAEAIIYHPIEQSSTQIYLPIVSNSFSGEYQYNSGSVILCDPNNGISYVHGIVEKNGEGVNGETVVFSYLPDGPIVASTISADPFNEAGFFAHILSTSGIREGDWYFWIVDSQQRRISTLIYLYTDSACQQAIIKFSDN